MQNETLRDRRYAKNRAERQKEEIGSSDAEGAREKGKEGKGGRDANGSGWGARINNAANTGTGRGMPASAHDA